MKFEQSLERKQAALESQLVRDFFLTFKYSQSSTGAQEKLYYGLAEYLNGALSVEDKEYIAGNGHNMLLRIERLQTPHVHKQLEESDFSYRSLSQARARDVSPTSAAFQNEWERFDEVCLRSLVMDEKVENGGISKDVVAAAAGAIAASDYHYQQQPRPNRSDNSDIHDSMFRRHVILAEPAGSPAFDTIFADAKTILEDSAITYLHRRVIHLAEEWEVNHPGQVFFEGMTDPRTSGFD